MTFEISDTPDQLDTFQTMMRPYSILEVARTGIIAVLKGGKIWLSGNYFTIFVCSLTGV